MAEIVRLILMLHQEDTSKLNLPLTSGRYTWEKALMSIGTLQSFPKNILTEGLQHLLTTALERLAEQEEIRL